MALVTIRETERVGEASFHTEYTFSDFEDFLKWEDYKQKVLKETFEEMLNRGEEKLNESLQEDGMSGKVVGLKETKH
jgi:hypothetical protein